MSKATAFHFKTDPHKNYARFPKAFLLQSLLVSDQPLNSQLYEGDILFLQLLKKLDIFDQTNQEDLLSKWLEDCSLQSINRLELASSYTLLLTELPQETEDLLHRSFAQQPEYLGKVSVDTTENLLHRHLYLHQLLLLGRIELPEAIFHIAHLEVDRENWDIQQEKEIQGYGYQTTFAQTLEDYPQFLSQEETEEVQEYLQTFTNKFINYSYP